MRGWRELGVAAALLCATAVPSARAQTSDADKARATELFKQARVLVARGKHAEACPKFADSHRLDPGGGTLLNLAFCNEAIGKTATAWAQLAECVAQARRDGRPDREKIALERSHALEPALMRLAIEVPASPDNGLEILRDGTPVARSAWGKAMPLDPGEYVVTVSAPNRKIWTTKVTLQTPGERQILLVPLLAETPPAPTASTTVPAFAPAVPTSTAAVGNVTPEPPPSLATPGNVKPLLLYVGGAAAAVLSGASLSVGVGFAVKTDSKNDDVAACRRDCEALQSEADSSEYASIAAFLVGAGVGSASALLFVFGALESRDARRGARLSVAPNGAVLHGQW